jgi:hypothetical protein
MSFIAAVNSTTGQIDYYAPHEDGDPIPYGYAGGLSPTQTVRHYDDQPDPVTQKDDGAGALVAKGAQEIADEATEAQLHSLDYINDLPASDPLRLQMRAMWCIAKKSGEVAEDTSFPDFLAWVAADQED